MKVIPKSFDVHLMRGGRFCFKAFGGIIYGNEGDI